MIKWLIDKFNKGANEGEKIIREAMEESFYEAVEHHYKDILHNIPAGECGERERRLMLKLSVLSPHLDRITEKDYLDRYGECQTLEEIMEMDYIKTLTGIDSATLQIGEAGDEFPYYDKERSHVIHIDKSTEFCTKTDIFTTHGVICVGEDTDD